MAQIKRIIRRADLGWLHKFKAGLALLCFLVMTISGLMNGVSVVTIGIRSFIVILVIIGICRVLVSIFKTYEELHGEG